ncbi:MAG: hypothetical protein EHM45_12405 [Desulfobacteraceae bacterium]|nr:MAG: hypothetical protein EHM45_12405 [Desulfobacteraceae bacterium]
MKNHKAENRIHWNRNRFSLKEEINQKEKKMRPRYQSLLKGGLFLLALAVVCVFAFQATAQDDASTWYKIYYTKAQKIQALRIIKELGSRAPEYFPDEPYPYIVARISNEEAWAYYEQGFQVEEHSDYDPRHAASIIRSDRAVPGYTCYRTAAETIADMKKLAADHPGLVTLKDIGDSYLKTTGQGGEDIWKLELSKSNGIFKRGRLLVTGGVHAREYVGPELALRFAEYLVDNYGTNPDVTWILNYSIVEIIPLVNPDGRKMADGTTMQTDWRKNNHKHDNNNCGTVGSNHYGADLNRNFKYKWGESGVDWDVCAETYPGKSAVSEPETKAVRNVMLTYRDYNTSPTSPASTDARGLFIDLHSHGRLVLWPWGYGDALAPNNTQLQTLGRKLAFFNNHTPEKASGLYPASGTTDDDLYAEKGIPAYTFEMGTAFFQGCSAFESTIAPQNLKALVYAAKACFQPYKYPKGPDALNVALSGTNLTATINDTRYNNSNGSEPTQNITAAEYYIDQFPDPEWPLAKPYAMSATDGSFNSKTENVRATINTSGLAKGKHMIYVRGKDAGNNWGPVSAVFLTVN